MFNKKTGTVLVAVVMAGALAACGGAKDTAKDAKPATGDTKAPAAATQTTPIEGTVTASGSSALLPLVKQAAEDFMAKHPKATINVTAGGSGTGLKNVADGTSNIGNSDIEAGDEYKDKGLVDHVVAIAPFALIANKNVPVDDLSKEKAVDIFTGKITNWKEIDGKTDAQIVVVHRPESSGSRALVKKIVLGGAEFTKEGVTQESSGAVATTVASTEFSIGYVDTAYIKDGLKALKFNGVAYSKETIKEGKYPLYGVEHMYTKGEATGATKAFIDYIMSPEFQGKKVEELKFLPADLLKK